MHIWQIRIVGALLAASLVGCAVPANTNVKVSAENIAKYNDLPALDVVTTLEKNLTTAKSANMPFLAPHYFQDASRILSECQGWLGNKSREELVNHAAKGDALLEKGRAIMTIVQYRFAQELELKARLDELHAAALLPKEYGKAMNDFSGLIDKVEREQPDNLDKPKEALLKTMQELEVLAVQESALRPSDTINAESKKKLADKQAPTTYAEALRISQEARKKIAAAPRDKALVERLGAEALFAARHAQQVNDRVVALQSQLKTASGSGPSLSGTMGSLTGAQLSLQTDSKTAAAGAEKFSIEQVVLQEESRLHDVSDALGLKDLRDLAQERQVTEIRRGAEELMRQAKAASSAVPAQEFEARLSAANEAVTRALARATEKERQLNERTTEVAEKDAQIKSLSERIAQLEEAAKATEKSKVAKPKKK